jgi:membrane protease subunit HflC
MMKGGGRLIVGVLIIVLGIAGLSAVFTVHMREQALVLQFGKVQRLVTEPGLNFKLPLVQNVVIFDKRVLDYDARAEEVPTRDQKQVVVDAFARYRIVDPLLFFQTVTNEEGMKVRLGNIINANLRADFGKVGLAVIMTPKRAELMRDIANKVREEGKDFGIEVLDVRLKRVDLPEENSQAIFRRMQTQREQVARKLRAEGARDKKRIRAEADRDATIIRANATKESEILRGAGDAGAQKIYNAAYGRDPGFFDFWVTMNTYRESLTKDTTRYIGPPGGDFFRFFGDIEGKGGERKKE